MRKFPDKIFVSGIGTGVGKTVVSAILVEALQADYWKPIQAGNLNDSDTMLVQNLVSNTTSKFHQEAYRLRTPASPHYAAKADNIIIEIPKITPGDSGRRLVVEGAGGLMVPLNKKDLVVNISRDLKLPVVLVVSNYLGSINHTLLSIEALKHRDIDFLGLIFTGENFLDNEEVIEQFGKVPILGRIARGEKVDKEFVLKQAQQLKNSLSQIFIL